MEDIVRQSEFKPLSISRESGKSTLQVTLIVGMIKMCINDNKPLSIDDILDCYISYQHKCDRYRTFSIFRFQRWEKLSEEDFRKEYQTISKAKAWFKNNLGSAIIQGKLLVIPIIEI